MKLTKQEIKDKIEKLRNEHLFHSYASDDPTIMGHDEQEYHLQKCRDIDKEIEKLRGFLKE